MTGTGGEGDRGPTPAAKVVDWERALQTVGGDRELLREIADAFLEETPAQVAKLREAVRLRREADARGVTHTLRGSLGYLGAGPALEVTLRLEKACGRSWEEADEALESLGREIGRLEKALRDEGPEPAPGAES